MHYSELIKKIENGRVEPIYLFSGEERFLINKIIEKIISKVIEPSNRNFNLEVLNGSETSYVEMLNRSQTLPFIGDRRVVIVKGVNEVKTSGIERLIEYCLNPSPSTCLILIADEIDEKGKLYNALLKKNVIVQFKSLNEKYALEWIMKRAGESGYRIDDDAKKYLLEIVGNNLQKLNNELEKIFTFKSDDKNIRTDDIKLLVEDTKTESVFKLTDSIGSKDIDGTLKLLDKMIEQGEMPLKIIGMISRQYRLILLTKLYLEIGVPLSELPLKAGFKPFLLKGYLSQSGKYSIREIKENFFKIQEADMRLKSSDIPGKIVLEKLAFDLLGGGLSLNRIN